jgi:hypothetical protein
MDMFGLCQVKLTELSHGFFHWIKRILLAGKNTVFYQFMERLG